MKYLIRWTGRLSGWVYVLVMTDFNNVIQENPWGGGCKRKNPSYNINICMRIYSLLPYLSKYINEKGNNKIFFAQHFPGPSFWGLINPQWMLCNKGRRQSPIDIEPSKMLYDPNLRPLSVDKHKVIHSNWDSLYLKSERATLNRRWLELFQLYGLPLVVSSIALNCIE